MFLKNLEIMERLVLFLMRSQGDVWSLLDIINKDELSTNQSTDASGYKPCMGFPGSQPTMSLRSQPLPKAAEPKGHDQQSNFQGRQ